MTPKLFYYQWFLSSLALAGCLYDSHPALQQSSVFYSSQKLLQSLPFAQVISHGNFLKMSFWTILPYFMYSLAFLAYLLLAKRPTMSVHRC